MPGGDRGLVPCRASRAGATIEVGVDVSDLKQQPGAQRGFLATGPAIVLAAVLALAAAAGAVVAIVHGEWIDAALRVAAAVIFGGWAVASFLRRRAVTSAASAPPSEDDDPPPPG